MAAFTRIFFISHRMNLDSLISASYDKKEYPALGFFKRTWTKAKPFSGLTILAATPIFRNTLTEYAALISGGAKLLIGHSLMVPADVKILETLANLGFEIVSPDSAPPVDIVLDCAGAFSKTAVNFGAVELTRSGLSRYEAAGFPAFIADSGKVKRIETSLGTGDGYFRALEKLGFKNLKDKRLLIFGSGKVGTGIALHAFKRGLKVEFVTDTSRRLPEFPEGTRVHFTNFWDTNIIAQKIHAAELIVTATGLKNALDSEPLTSELKASSAIIANMGVEDEFGPEIPKEHVLADKRPLNFILEEPTKLRYIDASLALHAALAETLVTRKNLPSGPLAPPQELEQKILDISQKSPLIGGEVKAMLEAMR